MQQLKNHLKEKNFKSTYLFYGSEVYLRDIYEKNIVDAILTEDEKLMNYVIFEQENCNIDAIIDFCETFPFLSEKKVAIVKKSGFFKSGKQVDLLANFDVPEYCHIIYIEDDVDKRNKLFKEVNSTGYVYEFGKLDEKTLIAWVGREFKNNKVNITKENIITFIKHCGSNMEILNGEILKLSSLKKDDAVTEEDIFSISTKSIQSIIFELVDAIGGKNSEVAVSIYNNLLFMKEHPISILTMITRQFRIMLQSLYLFEDNASYNDISMVVGIRSFTVKDYIRQSKNFSVDKLKYALQKCLDVDVSIKTGKIDAEMGVLLLIVEFSN